MRRLVLKPISRVQFISGPFPGASEPYDKKIRIGAFSGREYDGETFQPRNDMTRGSEKDILMRNKMARQYLSKL